MSYNCENILYWTETQLKYMYDVSLAEANEKSYLYLSWVSVQYRMFSQL